MGEYSLIELKRLVIVSHVIVFRHEGRLYAHAPYARELNIWADLFREVIIASPYREGPPFSDSEMLARDNITVAPQRESGGEKLWQKIMQVVSLPILLWDLARAVRSGDATHVRCPGNLGLLGVIVAPVFSRYLIAKYAGQWISSEKEPMSVRLQKGILRSSWWGGPVTVYGRWPDQPPHIVPFFTSVLTAGDVARARRAAQIKKRNGPLRILYVGRLSSSKNVDILLSGVARLPEVHCTIVGSGPEGPALVHLAEALGVTDRVRFTGGLKVDDVLSFYEDSDVLVLASDTEGWGKAIAEAMTFGLVCIGSDRGFIPQMLGEGRGIIIPPKNVEALVQALSHVAENQEESAGMGARSAAWAQKYSLEGLRNALRELLTRTWGVNLVPPVSEPAAPEAKSPR
jgi:glycosyltransferase involved in cell wall biosynthesis